MTAVPVRDELLSSWLARTASIYHTTSEGMLMHVGLRTSDARLLDFPPHIALAAPRLEWALHTTRGRVLRMTHPASLATLGRYIGHRRPLWRCQNCERRQASTAPAFQLRSWHEAWRLTCGGCRRPFHLPRTGMSPAASGRLWRDAVAGSALVAKFVVGRPCGLLPPDLVWKIGSAPLSAIHAPNALAAHLLVPEARHPSLTWSARQEGPTIWRSAPPKRLAMLALLARAEGRTREWVMNVLDAASPSGRRLVNAVLSELPDAIRDEVFAIVPRNATPSWTVRNGALLVQQHQIRLKLAANLRQIDEVCRELGAMRARFSSESHL